MLSCLMDIKEPLLLIGTSSPCGGRGSGAELEGVGGHVDVIDNGKTTLFI